MDIQTLQTSVRDFAAARGWPRFHTPKNLAMALMVEAAELLEIFQWLTPEESERAAADPPTRQHLGEEIADVLIYLLQMANQTRVDVPAAVLDKLQRNARKYPLPHGAVDAVLPASAALQGPATHVLLDFENVQPTEAAVRALVPQASKLWVFHGPHQKNVAERFGSFGNDLAIVPISRSGPDALDFHLSFYIGYLVARHPNARLVVLANDKGYEPMLDHVRQLHFDVQAIGVARSRKARTAGTPGTTRRRKQPDAAAPAQPGATRKAATRTAPKAAARTAADAAPAPAKVRAAKAAAAKSAPAKKAPPKAPPAPVLAPPSAPARTPARRKAVVPAPLPEPPAARRARKAASTVDARLLSKIEQGLRQLGAKRPTRRARLRGVVKSFLGAAASAEAVTVSLGRLLAAGIVTVDDADNVSYPRWT